MNRMLVSAIISLSLYTTKCKKSVDTKQSLIPQTVYHGYADSNRNYLALGDSYTIGQSVDPEERFPAQSVSILRNMGILINDPDYIATTGWTTDDLAYAISNNYPTKKYNVVSLLIGVNDQYQRHDTTGYRTKFLGLLNTAVSLARGNHQHVIVLSIPDYSVTPFAAHYDTATIRKEINWFNDINRAVTEDQHCLYLDVTAFTRDALTDPTLLANDGLHPSGIEYKIWAQPLSQLMYPFFR